MLHMNPNLMLLVMVKPGVAPTPELVDEAKRLERVAVHAEELLQLLADADGEGRPKWVARVEDILTRVALALHK